MTTSPCLLLLLVITSALLTAADQPVPGIVVDGKGRLQIGKIGIALVHFAPEWQVVGQDGLRPEAGFPTTADAGWTLKGTWPTRSGGSFAVEETLKGVDGVLSYAVHLTANPGLATNALALSVSLPTNLFAGRTLRFGDREVVLPAEITKDGIFDGTVAEVRLPGDEGVLVISGTLACHLQDDRQWGGDTYSLRFAIGSGTVTDASLALRIAQKPYETHPLDLHAAATMGWADPVADDQQGGWTDQGPDNDLSAITPGIHRMANVAFSILDPTANGGRSAIVLSGPQREYLPKEATVTIPDAKDRHLYLLHASAWTPKAGTVVGRLHLMGGNGVERAVDITAGKELGNWWAPANLDNGLVAWTAENRSAYVGLYCSHVDLGGAVSQVRIESSGTGVWMIAAMTTSAEAIPLPKEGPFFLIAGDDWRPVTSSLDVAAGGILDFSGLLDAPAGKHGQVLVKEGRFVFADQPEQRIRFYGTNFCFSANFPSHAEAEAIAGRIAREGYNSVRLHHYDWDLSARDAQDSTILNPDRRDRFDYLIAALEKRGIYISIDLFTFRQPRPAEIPELDHEISRSGYKAGVVFLESAMASWQGFARNVLSPVNPYTGKSLAQDPALVGICPVNEDTIWSVVNDDPGVLTIARERFTAWLAERTEKPVDDAARDRLWVRFLTEAQITANRRMTAFLRDLGCQAPITGVNFISALNMVPTRADASFDYVDNHAYWDHPGFPEKPWSLPMSYHNRSATAAGAPVPRDLMPARIAGKPYTVTEFNYVFPNQYRAEGGPLIGAYAALQGWDGLWRFAHAHALENLVSLRRTGGFDLGTDPLSRLSERLGILCFLRGDVAPAQGHLTLVVDGSMAWAGKAGWGGSNFPKDLSWIGLHTAIDSAWAEVGVPAAPVILGPEAVAAPAGGKRLVPEDDLTAQLVREGIIPVGAVDVVGRTVTSDTGEIRIQGADGRFQVATPRSEHFVFTATGEATGKLVSVVNGDLPTTVGVAAMDGKSLADSGRVLVLHLTDLQNTRVRFRGKARTLLESLGDLPHLVHAGKATLRLRLAGDWTAWACDLEGTRRREIPLRRDGDALVLECDQTAGDEPALVYDLQRR